MQGCDSECTKESSKKDETVPNKLRAFEPVDDSKALIRPRPVTSHLILISYHTSKPTETTLPNYIMTPPFSAKSYYRAYQI